MLRNLRQIPGCFVLVLACSSSHATQAPLRFLALDNRAPPLSVTQLSPAGRPILIGGIMKDWQSALAKELGRTPVDVLLPRPHQDQAAMQKVADLRCFVSPDWYSAEEVSHYDWPAPFFEVEERLVGTVGGKRAETLDDLAGMTIGTVFGYAYRALDPLFADGRIRRDNAPDEATLLRKQLAGRTDFAVMRTLDFNYFRKRDPQLAKLSLTPVVISRFALHCARPKDSNVSLQDLTAAQERLLKAGVLDKILAKYR